MDTLNHMLTDPLDDPGEAHGGPATEDCLLGTCRLALPVDLLEDPEVFFSVLSEHTWTDVLTDAKRQHLRQFLPQFPENNLAEQDSAANDLFNNKNFRFGNPLQQAQRLFRDGYFNPEVVKYRQLCAKSQRKYKTHCQQQYYHRLLKQILVSRKDLLDSAHGRLDVPLKPKALPTQTCAELQELKARRRVRRIIQEVKTECGDSNASSDDDWTPWQPTPQVPSSPVPTITLRVLSCISTQDMKTTEKPELGEWDLKAMLQKHKEKRRRQPDHPDLMISDIHLGDMISRVNVGRKGSTMTLFDMALPKRKMREERRRKKMRTVRVPSEELSEPHMSSETSAPSVSLATALPDTPTTPLAIAKEEMMETACQSSPVAVEEISDSFFNLLESILRAESFPTTSTIEEKVQMWQSSPACSLNPWFSAAPCWYELVVPALQFLAGEAKAGMMVLPSDFSPYVEFMDQTQHWRWTGPIQDAEKDLTALCQLWLDSKDIVVGKLQSPPQTENEELSEMTSPTPRVWTDYVVRPSTGDERHVFQVQEQQRYDQPHKAFTFRMHGFESVVGPVKGVFDKEMSLNKAREHTLLRSDRPAYVTILSLVRDAAARLPNGEGTRAEICELLRDSQFLAPDVTSAQVNTVVSGALDRLHYEKDPCVKYDIGRKLWIYLHRSRSQEEFERIHQAQAAAAKARKALQQKPKPPSKPKSGSKEGGGKTPGSLDASQDALGASPMSPTPTTATLSNLGVTPKSPLTSPAGTPTKTTVPETVRTSPGVLLVSPPSMPQLGTILPSSQSASSASQPPLPQHTARIVSHLGASSLSQVRVVSSQAGLGASQGSQPATLVQTSHQIRVPVSVGGKSISQTVVSLPLRTSSVSSPVQVQAARGPTTLSVSAVTMAKPHTGSPGSLGSLGSTMSPGLLQGVAGTSIKQVSITGQLGVKTPGSTGIPITATNLRIQGKDILRLPPSSITTDAKGQTVLRITPDMMATLTKSPLTTVKLSPDFLGTKSPLTTVKLTPDFLGTAGGGKSISATIHVTTAQPSSPSMANLASSQASCLGEVQTSKAVAGTSTLLKAAEETAIRLMPTLAVTIADQKTRTFSTVSTADHKSGGTTIRIMPGLGVIPQKQGHTITMTTATGSKPANTIAMATSGVVGAKGVTIGPPASGTSLTLGTATATVRQVPLSATVVTTQTGKLPARITVPLSVLSQPLKNKSVVTTPVMKGSLNANLSSLGRNIILTTMPAGTKLIAGNKPVSFVTAQQLQQLQQQGQATQVRIQTVPAQQLQHCVAGTSSKSVSAVVVKTAASLKCPPDQPPQQQ